MSRINTNVPSLVAQRVLSTQNTMLNLSLDRLSTGLRINTGKDDPAGLIASETMRAEKRAIQSAMTNIARANNVVSVAESGLSEISNLMNELEDLVDRSANESGISDEERNANQLQIDAILDSINRIANSTELQGKKLLNGTLEYDTSAVDATKISNLQINAARVPEGGYRSVIVDVVSGAQTAQITYISGTHSGATVTLEVAGNIGNEVVSFGSGTTVSAMAAAINQSKELTGVSAVVSGTDGLRFTSTRYGSDQFVKVKVLSGTYAFASGLTEGEGEDANVRINGTQATSDGLTVSLRSASLSVDIDLSTTFGSTAGGTTTFQIKGGGADFMIAPTVSVNGSATLGLDALTTSNLGSGAVGYLFTLATGQANALKTGNYSKAQQIVRAALSEVSTLRGRLGAFQKDTLETTANSLRIAFENVASAESVIRDTDFASETSNLTRSQILVQSATNVLRLANAAPQQVLTLLQ